MLNPRTPWSALSLVLVAVAGTAWSARVQAQERWRPAPAPLVTRWAKEVRPANPRPEYPRPLFERKEWESLNGLWEFAFDDANEGRAQGWHSGRAFSQRILVPFTFEAALSGIGKGKEVHERVWYRRTFDIPRSWRGRRVKLNFNASDWETTVWVNGKEQGVHRGGYAPFSFDITDSLKLEGPQEIVVAIYDPADPKQGGYQPKGKQLGSEGIWYTRTTGIWQSVWLEPVHAGAVDLTGIETEVDPSTRVAHLLVSLTGRRASEQTYELEVRRGDKRVAETRLSPPASAGTAIKLTTSVQNVELWSPEKPVLYDVTVRVKQRGKTVDEAKSYTAFRGYGIRNGRLTLNGKPYFFRGVLDQGYWPDGILTPPTDDAIKADVEMTKRFGFNMARKHVKVEDPRWYYWCDRLGVAVWQDMPSSHNLSTQEAKDNFEREWRAVVQATRSYPSVLHWIPFNENWGDPKEFQDHIVQLTRQMDETRPITDASGWTQRSFTDVIDVHDYSNNLIRHAVQIPDKPKVVGEYGGIALPVTGHTWTQGWGYQTVRDPQALLRRVGGQTSQLFMAANLSGFVYTQLTDVEQEMNGLMTYDRIPKTDPKRFAEIFEGRKKYDPISGFIQEWRLLGPIPAGTDLRTAQDNPANRAVLEKVLEQPLLPSEAFLDPRAGDSVEVAGTQLKWARVRVPGDRLDFHQAFGRESQNSVVYAVAAFNLSREVKNATLLFGSDDAAKVWLNGQHVHSIHRVRGVGIDDDIIQGLTLKPGRNLLVAKVAQGVGGWGLTARFETKDGKVVTIVQSR